jgi:hypothetical protein
MPLSLHDAFVPTTRQMLGALSGLVDKGEAFCRDRDLPDSELLEARLAEDMWPLPWHIRACWMHSGYVLERLATGVFTPDLSSVPADWNGMRAMLADARTRMDRFSPDELAEREEAPIGFEMNGKRLMELKGRDFLLSFSQPNLFFHATTFYSILRMKGVPLGKLDFMGEMRLIQH